MKDISEKEVSYKLYQLLKNYFIVHTEVCSKCTKYRIDFVIKDKMSDAIFGIELKKIDRKKGNDLGLLIQQVINYSNCEFYFNGEYRKIPIFVAPPISYDLLICPDEDSKIIIEGFEYFRDRHVKTHDHHTVNGMLGALGIGEIRTFNINGIKHIRFCFSNKEIWSNKILYEDKTKIKGLHKENYDKLITKING